MSTHLRQSPATLPYKLHQLARDLAAMDRDGRVVFATEDAAIEHRALVMSVDLLAECAEDALEPPPTFALPENVVPFIGRRR